MLPTMRQAHEDLYGLVSAVKHLSLASASKGAAENASVRGLLGKNLRAGKADDVRTKDGNLPFGLLYAA